MKVNVNAVYFCFLVMVWISTGVFFVYLPLVWNILNVTTGNFRRFTLIIKITIPKQDPMPWVSERLLTGASQLVSEQGLLKCQSKYCLGIVL